MAQYGGYLRRSRSRPARQYYPTEAAGGGLASPKEPLDLFYRTVEVGTAERTDKVDQWTPFVVPSRQMEGLGSPARRQLQRKQAVVEHVKRLGIMSKTRREC